LDRTSPLLLLLLLLLLRPASASAGTGAAPLATATNAATVALAASTPLDTSAPVNDFDRPQPPEPPLALPPLALPPLPLPLRLRLPTVPYASSQGGRGVSIESNGSCGHAVRSSTTTPGARASPSATSRRAHAPEARAQSTAFRSPAAASRLRAPLAKTAAALDVAWFRPQCGHFTWRSKLTGRTCRRRAAKKKPSRWPRKGMDFQGAVFKDWVRSHPALGLRLWLGRSTSLRRSYATTQGRWA
jgi:hypothetical protein